MTPTTVSDFYRRPYLTTAAFAAGVLLFLLPFFNINCNNITMAQISGISMATGSKPSMSRDLERMGNRFSNKDAGDSEMTVKQGGEGRLFVSALIALVLGVIGLLLSLINRGRDQRPSLLVGILAVLAMIAAWIEISTYIKANTKPENGNAVSSDFPGMMNVSASPTFWFILSLFCFAAAAFLSYQKSAAAMSGKVPSPAAPQLDIRNPGDQSEFPAAPEEELGPG